MSKFTILLLVSLLSLGSSLYAQSDELDLIGTNSLRLTGETDAAQALALYRPDLFQVSGGSLLLHTLPVTILLDGRRFPISGDLNRMGVGPLGGIPLAFLSAVRVQKTDTAPMYATDAPGGVVDFQLNRVVTGGEAGVFYGRSGGKYGREDFESYITGGIGTEKLQISGGVSYDSSSGRGAIFSR